MTILSPPRSRTLEASTRPVGWTVAGCLAVAGYGCLKAAWALGSTVGITDVQAWQQRTGSLPSWVYFLALWGTIILDGAAAAILLALSPAGTGAPRSVSRRALRVLARVGAAVTGSVGVVGLASVAGPWLGIWHEGVSPLATWVFVLVYGCFTVVAAAFIASAHADAHRCDPQDAAGPRRRRPGRPRRTRRGSRLAWSAFVVGVAYALVSVVWGLGGTWGLSTVGGGLERAGRARDPLLIAAVWASVVAKLVAAALGVLVVGRRRPSRLLVAAAWTAAGILTVYGSVLTSVGLLVQAGAIATGPGADTHALLWHAYLWDPWLAVWGILLAAALWRSRCARAR